MADLDTRARRRGEKLVREGLPNEPGETFALKRMHICIPTLLPQSHQFGHYQTQTLVHSEANARSTVAARSW